MDLIVVSRLKTPKKVELSLKVELGVQLRSLVAVVWVILATYKTAFNLKETLQQQFILLRQAIINNK